LEVGHVLLEDTVKPLPENSHLLQTESPLANEKMVDDFIPTILMNLLLVQYFLALSNFLSNKLKKNGKYIRIETNTNKY